MGNRICTLICAAVLVFATMGGCSRNPDRPSAASERPMAIDVGRLNAKTAEDIWHLRSGLNVAALSCKGKGVQTVHADYNRLLSRHRKLLDDAAAIEIARFGKGAYDTHITQVYNRFSNIRDRGKFCGKAVEIAQKANRTNSAEFASFASASLAELQSAQRGR